MSHLYPLALSRTINNKPTWIKFPFRIEVSVVQVYGICIYYYYFCVLGEGRVRGRPRSGWMDGVKMALGNR